MTMADKLNTLTNDVTRKAPHIFGREHAKAALVTPFIRDVLGYDDTDPSVVVPHYPVPGHELRADWGIVQDGTLLVLIDVEPFDADLTGAAIERLHTRMHATGAPVGVLTNGERYQLHHNGNIAYTELDLGKPDAPWFSVITSHVRQTRLERDDEQQGPDPVTVDITRKHYEAQHRDDEKQQKPAKQPSCEEATATVIKGIVHDIIPMDRLKFRREDSYCTLDIDGNRHNPLVRFRFGARKKTVMVFAGEKGTEGNQEGRNIKHEQFHITQPGDAAKHSDMLREAARGWEKLPAQSSIH